MNDIINFLPNLHNLTELYNTEDIKAVLNLLNDKSVNLLHLIIKSNENKIIKRDLLYMTINHIMLSKQNRNPKNINSVLLFYLKIWCFKLNIDLEI